MGIKYPKNCSGAESAKFQTLSIVLIVRVHDRVVDVYCADIEPRARGLYHI